jgi:hypothetical protein
LRGEEAREAKNKNRRQNEIRYENRVGEDKKRDRKYRDEAD